QDRRRCGRRKSAEPPPVRMSCAADRVGQFRLPRPIRGRVNRSVTACRTFAEVQMSPKNRSDAIRERAQKAMASLKPAAERAKPLAKSTGEAAKRSMLRTRAWAAPQVERTGKALQESVAPKVSSMLSSAAKRIDPARPRHRRWKTPFGLATVTAAGGAVAAFLRNKKKANVEPPAAAPTQQTGNGQA